MGTSKTKKSILPAYRKKSFPLAKNKILFVLEVRHAIEIAFVTNINMYKQHVTVIFY